MRFYQATGPSSGVSFGWLTMLLLAPFLVPYWLGRAVVGVVRALRA